MKKKQKYCLKCGRVMRETERICFSAYGWKCDNCGRILHKNNAKHRSYV